MAEHPKFDVFTVVYRLCTLQGIPDPQTMEDWAETPEEEKEGALKIYQGVQKGKVKFWEATVADLHDENVANGKTVASDLFHTDESDGAVELETLSAHMQGRMMERYRSICPVEQVQKRLIQWDPKAMNLRKLN